MQLADEVAEEEEEKKEKRFQGRNLLNQLHSVCFGQFPRPCSLRCEQRALDKHISGSRQTEGIWPLQSLAQLILVERFPLSLKCLSFFFRLFLQGLQSQELYA